MHELIDLLKIWSGRSQKDHQGVLGAPWTEQGILVGPNLGFKNHAYCNFGMFAEGEGEVASSKMNQ